jgi:ribosomal protein S4
VVHEELGNRPMTATWLKRDGASGRVVGLPPRSDIDADIREDLIVESY